MGIGGFFRTQSTVGAPNDPLFPSGASQNARLDSSANHASNLSKQVSRTSVIPLSERSEIKCCANRDDGG